MDTVQNVTQSQTETPTDAERVTQQERLTYLQDNYITFCASSGISQAEDGNFTVMTVTQFAAAAGVSRQTLYRWQKSIPSFWVRVDERAREIFNMSTKFAIFKGLKLKAMAGDVKAAEMVLSHYSDYTPPAQKHEVKLSGWGDMVREARKRAIKADRPVQDAEIVTAISSSPPPSTEKPNPLPTGGPQVAPPPIDPEPKGPPVPLPAPQPEAVRRNVGIIAQQPVIV